MSRDRIIALAILILCFVGVGLSFFQKSDSESVSEVKAVQGSMLSSLTSLDKKDRVLVLYLNGVISEGYESGVLGYTISPAEKLKKDLLKAVKDKHIKGILIRINSPGGTVGVSQEIYHAVRDIQDKGIPVVASLGDVAASGGYYIASASSWIIANPGTLTGSIGVISSNMNYRGLLQKLGLQERTFKAGKYKDLGAGNRTMTAEERKIMQSLLDNTYQQFLNDVYKGRRDVNQSLTREIIAKNAEGLIYTGEQALKANLVDQLGGYTDALEKLQELVKEKSKGKIKKDLPVTKSVKNSDKLTELLGVRVQKSSMQNIIARLLGLPEQSSLNSILKHPILVLAPEFI